MRISVAMAAYNGELYIREQMDSILSQTVLPDEIVVSDDNSNDSTYSILEEYQSKYKNIEIKLYKNPGKGISSNFENAIRNTIGDIVFLCDQDDLWMPEKIEVIKEIMQTNPENIVIHNAFIVRECEDGRFQKEETNLFEHANLIIKKEDFSGSDYIKVQKGKLYKLSYRYTIVNGMCMCIRRAYLMKILPFSEGDYHDKWISFCGIVDDTIAASNRCLSYYRIHRNNNAGLFVTKKKKKLKDRIKTYNNRGIETIKRLYIWYRDCYHYDPGLLHDKYFAKHYDFYTIKRKKCFCCNRIIGLSKLIRCYYHGDYEPEGKGALLHDLYYCFGNSRAERITFFNGLDKCLRITKDTDLTDTDNR